MTFFFKGRCISIVIKDTNRIMHTIYYSFYIQKADNIDKKEKTKTKTETRNIKRGKEGGVFNHYVNCLLKKT